MDSSWLENKKNKPIKKGKKTGKKRGRERAKKNEGDVNGKTKRGA